MIRFIQYLVFSNFIIAFGAASFLALGFLVLGKPLDYYAINFTFSSTLLMYNLQRIHKLKYQELDRHNVRHNWIIKNKKRVHFVIVICILNLTILLPFFSWKELIGLGILGGISFFYSYKTKIGALRSVPGIKIFLIAFVWAFTVTIFTVGEWIEFEDLVLFLYNFTFILAITIPFDIRDLPYDDPDFYTIPQILGEKGARIIALLLMCGSLGFLFLLIGEFSFFLSLVYGIFAYLVFNATTSKKELYFSGIMDFTLTISLVGYLIFDRIAFFHF